MKFIGKNPIIILRTGKIQAEISLNLSFSLILYASLELEDDLMNNEAIMLDE